MEYSLKKSLGQHFLKDESVCNRIVDEVSYYPLHNLLEVGPGGGALTKYLLKLPNINLRVVELDLEKVKYLESKYPAIKDKIIHKSFLDIDPPFQDELTIVGNFPYNISTQILFKVLEWKDIVQVVVGMFQKEVAERAASNEGNKVYGILSVLVQAFYKVEYLFDVDPTCFNPPPKVMSGVIRLIKRNDVPEMKSERAFFNLVKTAFNQRRKTLRNALRGLFTEEELKDELFNKRAEVLSVNDFASLTFRMKQFN